MSLMPALNEVSKMRADNSDIFYEPKVDASFLYVHEEVCELYRVAQRLLTPEHLRGNELDMELDIKKHLELVKL